jgi:GNAT superfamily N-acetyltransferase
MDGAPGPAAAEIRRVRSSDLAALSDFFAGLSPSTRYLRFFAPLTPSRAMLCRLSGGTGTADAVVAIAGGAVIGHAMAADRAGPRGGPMTDIGVVVADAWQGGGVGSALVRALITRAQARGVTSLAMDVLPGNHRVLAMIASHWTAARTEQSADCLTVQVRLPQHRQRRPLAAAGAGGPAVTDRGNRRQPVRQRSYQHA